MADCSRRVRGEETTSNGVVEGGPGVWWGPVWVCGEGFANLMVLGVEKGERLEDGEGEEGAQQEGEWLHYELGEGGPGAAAPCSDC